MLALKLATGSTLNRNVYVSNPLSPIVGSHSTEPGVPPQESQDRWFKSDLLRREVNLSELYELSQNELDLLMAETATIRSDPDSSRNNRGKFVVAGYVLELAKIISDRRTNQSS